MTLRRGNHTDMAMCSETEEFRGELGRCGIARIYTLPKPHHYRVSGRCVAFRDLNSPRVQQLEMFRS